MTGYGLALVTAFTLFLFTQHLDNLQRLFAGTERRIDPWPELMSGRGRGRAPGRLGRLGAPPPPSFEIVSVERLRSPRGCVRVERADGREVRLLGSLANEHGVRLGAAVDDEALDRAVGESERRRAWALATRFLTSRQRSEQEVRTVWPASPSTQPSSTRRSSVWAACATWTMRRSRGPGLRTGFETVREAARRCAPNCERKRTRRSNRSRAGVRLWR